MPTDPELITSPEVAHLLGKSMRTVQRMADAGELPVAQKLPGPNGARLFRRVEIEALVAAGRTEQVA
ncbi:helix-turn-helix transcriptional regulator [Kineococcus gynurae]|uniref:Helix-turn-helix transcriptional regulator n=1 Tax=Kineococcus gynurae TaxID=452979 RepID=A0ABV5LWV6_9ACTN